MTGTASESIERYETKNNRSINFELFSAWLFGNINTGCVLNDITQCGCSIRMPKDSNAPSNIFNLLIMSPDDERSHTVISAQIRWINSHNSVEHDIASIKFLNVKAGTREKINALMQHNIVNRQSEIKCCLLKK